MPKILLVDDDDYILKGMRKFFEIEKYDVMSASTGAEAQALLESHQFDIIVTDWGLPDITGPEICKKFREAGGVTPILMLTGKSDVEDKEIGFEAGADDYLTKPCNVKELSSRVKALLRRASMAPVAQAPQSPSQNEVKVGATLLDRYEILELLGKGMTGIVYKGRHKLLGRLVAVKMVQSHHFANASMMGRFWLEAKTVSSLSHPNIITLYDFGMSSTDVPFLVMDFVEGVTLHELIKAENHLDVARAVNIFNQLCDALGYMHSKGLIHRDIKPGNIMVTRDESGDEKIKLIDFGLVKLITQDDQERLKLTHEGEQFGTPLYMSPEQCAGEELDARSDIYSAGCLLYEMLTGVQPFSAKTALQTMLMRVTEGAKPFSAVRPDLQLPEPLEKIVIKALSRERENRYQTMEELKGEMEHIWLRRAFKK